MTVVVGTPAVLALGAQVAKVHGIADVAAHPDDVVVVHGSFQATAVLTEDAGGVHRSRSLSVSESVSTRASTLAVLA